MEVLVSERLRLRWLDAGDAAFILRLVNDPDWLRFIGDRGIRTPEDAAAYIENNLLQMCRRLGFGLYLAELRADATPVGICGLIKRDTLEDVDIGFAFLPEYRGLGYGYEAASATLAHARRDFGLSRVVAITTRDNERSMRLLEKLGMRYEGMTAGRDGATPLRLYSTTEAAVCDD
ncbi:MAG TPA: GNAT family N-acetyltransferase [Pyrinomonadaceae bacterium]|jgi:RimJ/RimL family protein N-acetyltransferase|nr:GNAT family N-acetyltransferase [Pyrinomonadaceae bacterium]